MFVRNPCAQRFMPVVSPDDISSCLKSGFSEVMMLNVFMIWLNDRAWLLTSIMVKRIFASIIKRRIIDIFTSEIAGILLLSTMIIMIPDESTRLDINSFMIILPYLVKNGIWLLFIAVLTALHYAHQQGFHVFTKVGNIIPPFEYGKYSALAPVPGKVACQLTYLPVVVC